VHHSLNSKPRGGLTTPLSVQPPPLESGIEVRFYFDLVGFPRVHDGGETHDNHRKYRTFFRTRFYKTFVEPKSVHGINGTCWSVQDQMSNERVRRGVHLHILRCDTFVVRLTPPMLFATYLRYPEVRERKTNTRDRRPSVRALLATYIQANDNPPSLPHDTCSGGTSRFGVKNRYSPYCRMRMRVLQYVPDKCSAVAFVLRIYSTQRWNYMNFHARGKC
jgi:hypothetical protein